MGWPTMAYKGISKLFQLARSAAALFWPHLRAGAFLRRLHLHLHHTHIVLYCNILHIVLYCNILHIVLLIFAFASAQTILPLERNIYNKHLSWQISMLKSRVLVNYTRQIIKRSCEVKMWYCVKVLIGRYCTKNPPRQFSGKPFWKL